LRPRWSGHFGGFAAEQRATVFAAGFAEAGDDVFKDFAGKGGGAEVVEEEERGGTLDEDVVDAVVDEVLSDRFMLVRHVGDFELGADAVGAGDEQEVFAG